MREPRDYEAPLCAEVGGDHWFPDRDLPETLSKIHINFAKTICGRCMHRDECAEWGIRNERYGIWGGLTDYERRTIRKARKIVVRDNKIA